MPPLKTWSHLAKNRRRPTEYEIVSTNLLWSTSDPSAPWAMGPDTAVSRLVLRHRNGSALAHPDWDGFRDPHGLVYRTYNAIQDGQEAYVDGLLDDHAKNEHDDGLPPTWVDLLARLYTPGRFLTHALQMSSAYQVVMAPASTIVNCFAFQCGDQLRWVSRLAYRTVELSRAHPKRGFAAAERKHWESTPEWQGFRELVERALITWDWAEQFVAINLVAKPAVDAAVLRQLGRAARDIGDTLAAFLADAQLVDSDRSRIWSSALVSYATTVAGNTETLRRWTSKWAPLGDRAIEAYCAGLENGAAAARAAKDEVHTYRQRLGLE